MDVSADLFSLVINNFDERNNKEITKELLLTYLNNEEFIEDYYLIKHDKDDARVHYHLIIKTYKTLTKTHLIKDIARSLLISDIVISCQVVRHFKQAIRYLTHKDELDKYHYSNEEVISKSFGTYESKCEMTIDINYLTYNDVYELCKKCEYLMEVYAAVGLRNAKLYRNVINDIWRECRSYGCKE